MQQRTSTPDQYSATVKLLYRKMRDGDISHTAFATAIQAIWEKRHA